MAGIRPLRVACSGLFAGKRTPRTPTVHGRCRSGFTREEASTGDESLQVEGKPEGSAAQGRIP
ncbi:hypothetical protein DV532_19185 [Pseudomonas sp. Leaf58]|nr:hypothetical protein DV532_19185 [Pseudomonas sp. Leaf58]